MYDGNGLQECLKEFFTPFRKMKDLMKPIVIPAYSSDKQQIYITNDNEFAEWDISEAILAATASPFYFPPMGSGN